MGHYEPITYVLQYVCLQLLILIYSLSYQNVRPGYEFEIFGTFVT